MGKMNIRAALAVALIALLGAACTDGTPGEGTGSFYALVFPSEGRTGVKATQESTGNGTTVAIVIDSNYIDLADSSEWYTLHRDRVNVYLENPDTYAIPSWTDPVALNVRSVLTLQVPSTSNLHGANTGSRKGAWITTVVVDLPPGEALVGAGNPDPNYPFNATLRVDIDNNQGYYESNIEIVGTGGKPNEIVDRHLMLDAKNRGAISDANVEPLFYLDSQPLIRLRLKSKLLPTYSQNNKYTNIGGIEFDFVYVKSTLDANNATRNCIKNGSAPIRAYGSTEAVDATASVGPVQSYDVDGGRTRKVVHIMMMDPKGIDLYSESGADDDIAGQGPLIDLGLDWVYLNRDVCPLDSTFFEIRNLRVVSVAGELINEVEGAVDIDGAEDIHPDADLRFYSLDPPPGPLPGCG